MFFDQLDIAEDTTFRWGGDINMIFDIDLDEDGGSPELYIKSVSKLLPVMSEIDLCDIYGVRNPDSRRFTWQKRSPFKQRRLDLFSYLIAFKIILNLQKSSLQLEPTTLVC